MKKMMTVLLAGAIAMSFAACSDPGESAGFSASESSAVETSTEAEVSSEVSSEESVQADAELASDYYFRDGVVVTEDLKIEITDYKVIPVGETGNEYGDAPVIAFWFSTTNRSEKDNISPIIAWSAVFSAVQDNDPNMVNKLDVGMLPDEAYSDTQLAEIKPNGTVDCTISYVLDDETTPVTLTATKGILGEELGSQDFPIA